MLACLSPTPACAWAPLSRNTQFSALHPAKVAPTLRPTRPPSNHLHKPFRVIPDERAPPGLLQPRRLVGLSELCGFLLFLRKDVGCSGNHRS